MEELIEHNHEQNGRAVPNEQLQHQQGCTHIHIDVSLVKIPHEEEEGVLDEPHHVVHQEPVPVLRLADEVGVVDFQLHRRPAEHVDPGVEEGEDSTMVVPSRLKAFSKFSGKGEPLHQKRIQG